MTQIFVRPAQIDDAKPMAEIINVLIKLGGTTAHQTPFDAARMTSHYLARADCVSCHVAEENGVVLGFQSLNWPSPKYEDLPKGYAMIASFVALGQHGKGIGEHLLEATLTSAKEAGVTHIDATIRADNTGGLRYYSKMGFSDRHTYKQVPLSDGTCVDRVQKVLALKQN